MNRPGAEAGPIAAEWVTSFAPHPRGIAATHTRTPARASAPGADQPLVLYHGPPASHVQPTCIKDASRRGHQPLRQLGQRGPCLRAPQRRAGGSEERAGKDARE